MVEYCLWVQGPGPCLVACKEIAEGKEENSHDQGDQQQQQEIPWQLSGWLVNMFREQK